MTWQPMQMPSIFLPGSEEGHRSASSRPVRFSTAMEAAASPTPGKISDSACATSAGIVVTKKLAPRCRSAF